MKTEFSTLDIVKALGIPRERLREWIDRGFIKPSIQEAEGQGTKSLFSLADLYRIEAFKWLVNMGLSRVVAAHFNAMRPDDHYLNKNVISFRISKNFDSKRRVSEIDAEAREIEGGGDEGRLKDFMERLYQETREEIEAKKSARISVKEIISRLFEKSKSIFSLSVFEFFVRSDITILISVKNIREEVNAAIEK